MNMKSILLGTAAALVASGAYAADLPGEAAPAAVDYVKVCDAFGAGFFYIPGTDTCLDISGRVRAGISFSSKDKAGAGTVADPYTGGTTVSFTNSARVQFDARSATDLGTLRTFAEFSMEGVGGDNRGVKVNNAFIQLGYVTLGRQDDVTDGDVLYGDNGFTSINGGFGDNGVNGATVLVDNLGGGFYVGAGVYASGSVSSAAIYYRDAVNGDQDSTIDFEGIIGIAKQSWGSADISVGYVALSDEEDHFAVKGTAEFLLSDAFKARVTGAYVDTGAYNWETASVALKYQATADLDVYTGGAYVFNDHGIDDNWVAQVGADYTIVPGLTLTGEVNYQDLNSEVSGLLRVSREW